MSRTSSSPRNAYSLRAHVVSSASAHAQYPFADLTSHGCSCSLDTARTTAVKLPVPQSASRGAQRLKKRDSQPALGACRSRAIAATSTMSSYVVRSARLGVTRRSSCSSSTCGSVGDGSVRVGVRVGMRVGVCV
eukprot:350941-Chlamydomonas_euryale.AAC.4